MCEPVPAEPIDPVPDAAADEADSDTGNGEPPPN